MSFDTQNQQTQPNGGAVNTPPSGIGAPAPLTQSESLAEFQALLKRYEQDLQPRGVVEQTMVYQLASTAWRLRRLPFLESVLVGVLFQRGTAWKELDLLSRHETRLNGAFEHTFRAIEARHKAPPAPRPEKTAAAQPVQPTEEAKAAAAPGSSGQPAAAPPEENPLYSAPVPAPVVNSPPV